MTEKNNLLNSEIYLSLIAPAYPLAEAGRLVGISSGRVGRWLRGYEYSYKVAGDEEAIIGRQDSLVHPTTKNKPTHASFLDLIDLLFVKRFIDRGYTLQFIRKALNEAQTYLDTPHFASARFFTSGKDIFLENLTAPDGTESLIALLKGGQQAFPNIVKEIGEKIDFEDITGFGFAARWFPLGKEKHIVIDPQISFGQPTIFGSRITTSNIYDLYLGEKKKIENVSKWFNIPTVKIKTAIQFEHSIHA